MLTKETLKAYLNAVTTQYQICGGYENLTSESFNPRNSIDAPTLTQLHNLREAHLNIQSILKECIRLTDRVEELEGGINNSLL